MKYYISMTHTDEDISFLIDAFEGAAATLAAEVA